MGQLLLRRSTAALGVAALCAALLPVTTDSVAPHAPALQPSAVTAPADRADTLTAARRAASVTQGRWLRERIPSPRDVDWFPFQVAEGGRHLVTLGGLPADYALSLHDGRGTQLGRSQRRGRGFEELFRKLAPGRYFAQVASPRGASSSRTYALKIRRLPDTIHVLSQRVWRDPHPGAPLKVEGELYNGTSRWQNVQLAVSYLDSNGTVVARERYPKSPLVWGSIAPARRVLFSLTRFNVPRSAVAARVELAEPTGPGAPESQPRLVVRDVQADRHPRGAVVYSARIHNAGANDVRGVTLFGIRYDAYGRYYDFQWTSGKTIPAGQARRFELPTMAPVPARYRLVLRTGHGQPG